MGGRSQGGLESREREEVMCAWLKVEIFLLPGDGGWANRCRKEYHL